jgi:hypothetical protein
VRKSPPLDYFVGGVPALAIFTAAMGGLIEILNLDSRGSINQRLYELCFVGAVSYFEAFCKDHFASILNIVPQLISKLSQAGIETRIDPMQLLEARSGLRAQIGFMVSERMDMGTADQVNKLYGHILRITPFSKDNRDRFAVILRDRNLFVHHGGIFTSTYVKQSHSSQQSSDRSRAFRDSKVLSAEDIVQLVGFLREIAIPTAKSSKSALELLVNQLEKRNPSLARAVDLLDYMWTNVRAHLNQHGRCPLNARVGCSYVFIPFVI